VLDPARFIESLFTRLWATPVYRLLDDPDGRPLRMRLRKTF
jgi:hypothetical protein